MSPGPASPPSSPSRAPRLAALRTLPRFASDAAGLEKALRLLQAGAQLVLAHSSSSFSSSLGAAHLAAWATARRQFALGRRYLRFFRFVDAFGKAVSAVGRVEGVERGGELVLTVEVVKWSCLGTYLLLESCTILHAMTILTTPIGTTLLITANKFWFAALLAGLLSSMLQLLQLPSLAPEPPSRKKRHSTQDKQRPSRDEARKLQRAKEVLRKRRVLISKLIIDVADLTIPGAVTGWWVTSDAVVGWATVVSTVVGSEEIWVRVQRESEG